MHPSSTRELVKYDGLKFERYYSICDLSNIPALTQRTTSIDLAHLILRLSVYRLCSQRNGSPDAQLCACVHMCHP